MTFPFAFVGPAKRRFENFEEQCEWYLESYCPNWRNYQQPSGYVLPPKFKFKHAELSDEVFEQLAGSNGVADQNLIQGRKSDTAEHMVHRDLSQLAYNNIALPFVSIRNLAIDDQRLGILKEMHPALDWENFHVRLKELYQDAKHGSTLEYDVCLISQKFGFVFIEVKSSAFDGKSDFVPGNQHFPKAYKYGLQQLQSATTFLGMIEKCSGVALPLEAAPRRWIRRILVTPNFSKVRYDEWWACLTLENRKRAQNYIDDSLQVFAESCAATPLSTLYPLLAHLLESAEPFALEQRRYEAYAKFITGSAFMTRLSSSTELQLVTLEEVNYSHHLATVIEGFQISDQYPVDNKQQQAHSKSLLKRASAHPETKSSCRLTPLIFLSPEQNCALKGPKHQVLNGPAGTGKTLILLSKALELLDSGQSVVVVAPNIFRARYKMAFDEHGFKRYKIFRWRDIYVDINRKFFTRIGELYELMMLKKYAASEYLFHCIDVMEREPEFIEKMNALYSDQNFFIDDAFVEVMHYEGSVAILAALFAFAKHAAANKYMWFAVDQFQQVGRNATKTGIDEWETEEEIFRYALCSTTVEKLSFMRINLRRVMRCSSEVYQTVFRDLESEHVAVAGHKLPGVMTRRIEKQCLSSKDAAKQLLHFLPEILSNLVNPNIESVNYAVIILSGGLVSFPIDIKNELSKLMLNTGVTITSIDKFHCLDAEESAELPLFNLNCLTSDIGPLSVNHAAVIISYHDVASFEWPLVIHAHLSSKRSSSKTPYEIQRLKMERYISRSRAIVGLIEFDFWTE